MLDLLNLNQIRTELADHYQGKTAGRKPINLLSILKAGHAFLTDSLTVYFYRVVIRSLTR